MITTSEGDLSQQLSRHQVRFTSNVDCDSSLKSEKTDKRNNVRRKSRGNAKVTGVRSKFFIESIRQELFHLQQENALLRRIVIAQINPPSLAEQILLECESPPVDIFLRSSIVMEEDETKADESEDYTKEVNNGISKPPIRIGQEIEIKQLQAPVTEFHIPLQEDNVKRNKSCVERSMEFNAEKTEAQCLADAFNSEFAF